MVRSVHIKWLERCPFGPRRLPPAKSAPALKEKFSERAREARRVNLVSQLVCPAPVLFHSRLMAAVLEFIYKENEANVDTITASLPV